MFLTQERKATQLILQWNQNMVWKYYYVGRSMPLDPTVNSNEIQHGNSLRTIFNNETISNKLVRPSPSFC